MTINHDSAIRFSTISFTSFLPAALTPGVCVAGPDSAALAAVSGAALPNRPSKRRLSWFSTLSVALSACNNKGRFEMDSKINLSRLKGARIEKPRLTQLQWIPQLRMAN